MGLIIFVTTVCISSKALSGGYKKHSSSSTDCCSSKEPVCDIEGGIKFNPCYLSKHDMLGTGKDSDLTKLRKTK